MRNLLLAATLTALVLGCSGAEPGDDLATEPAAVPTTAAPEPTPSETAAPNAPATDGAVSLDGVETYDDLSQDHVDGPVDYEQTPPVGGPHAGAWLNCGFYPEPVPAENAVHSLEHGAVWITYDDAVDPAALQQLAAEEYVIVSPFEGLASPVVASAWGVQLSLDGPDDPRLELFVEQYAAGPQTPEPGAPCDGGIGEPEPPPASV